MVADRSAATLIPILERHIIPGTTVVSDSWAAYDKIDNWKRVSPWLHLSVNHHEGFVNRENGAHTQQIERLWREFKEKKKRQQGIRRCRAEQYSGEFLMRNQWKVRGLDPLQGTIQLFSVSPWDKVRSMQ